ncbi:MAG: GGDEF domain-containing protein [Lachnospiraceae bacterium]|nr:GGDEF domain-containing protein [Lachnospiraceae bacterium]
MSYRGEAILQETVVAKEKGRKLQLIIPTAVMIGIFVIMLLTYVRELVNASHVTVENRHVEIARDYREAFVDGITDAKILAEYMAELLVKSGDGNLLSEYTNVDLAMSLMDSLKNHTDAYQVVMANNRGQGMLADGTRVSVLYEPYYCNSAQKEAITSFVEKEGISEKSAIVTSIPITGDGKLIRGYIYMYFNLQSMDMEKYLNDSTSEINYSFAVLHGKDDVLWHSEDGCEELFRNMNFVSNVKDLKFERMGFNTFSSRMTSHRDIKAVIKDETEEHFVFGVSLEMEDLYLLMETDLENIEREEKAEWEVARKILYWISLAVSAFIILMMIFTLARKKDFERRSKELNEKAETDLLTELNNKISTEEKIQNYLATHKKEQAMMFVLDIDNFKKINDTMGHAFGDEVLRAVGKGLRAEFRYSDIIGRMGGDEFCILLKGLNNDALITKEANRLLYFFRNLVVGDYVKYSATASIGAAVFPRDGENFEELYKAADKALYKAKRRGKNQLAFYNASFDTYDGDVEDEEEQDSKVDSHEEKDK